MTPSIQYMILNSNDTAPTTQDLLDIKKKQCIHCACPFDETRKITFTRTSNGKLLWWHRRTQGSNHGLTCHPVHFNRKEYIRDYQKKHYISKRYQSRPAYIPRRIKYMMDLEDDNNK